MGRLRFNLSTQLVLVALAALAVAVVAQAFRYERAYHHARMRQQCLDAAERADEAARNLGDWTTQAGVYRDQAKALRREADDHDRSRKYYERVW